MLQLILCTEIVVQTHLDVIFRSMVLNEENKNEKVCVIPDAILPYFGSIIEQPVSLTEVFRGLYGKPLARIMNTSVKIIISLFKE